MEEVKFLKESTDVCIWQYSTNGQFTVKSFYNWLNGYRNLAPVNKFLWRKFIPPSRSTVVWRAFLGYLPTDDKLSQKGFCFSSRCCFCKDSYETISHLLVTCQVSKQLWLAISSLFGVRANCIGDFRSLILDAISVQLSSQLKILRNATIVSTVWILWTERNNTIFNNQTVSVYNLLRLLWKCIKDEDLFRMGTTNGT